MKRHLVDALYSGMVSALVGAIFLCCFEELPAAETDAAFDRLSFTAAEQGFRFDTGFLRGSFFKDGRPVGLRPVVAAASGELVTGLYGLLSPYRLLTTEARFGPAAWDWTSRAKLLPDGAVEVAWLPDDIHPLEMKAEYRFAAPNVLDFSATVTPKRQLNKFELFLASYFSNQGFSSASVYVREPPGSSKKAGFMEAVEQDGHWLMFPRDRHSADLITDGRWTYPPHPVAWKIMPQFSAPLAVRRDAASGLTAVLMASAEDCFAVSTPFGEESHRSLYLSLFGRDLKAGETTLARARLVIDKNISDRQAIKLYEAYLKERK